MSGTFTIHASVNIYEQASRRFFLLYAITSSDQSCLGSSERIRNTESEQRAPRKYLRSIITKIAEISVGSQMERFVSVCSDRSNRPD